MSWGIKWSLKQNWYGIYQQFEGIIVIYFCLKYKRDLNTFPFEIWHWEFWHQKSHYFSYLWIKLWWPSKYQHNNEANGRLQVTKQYFLHWLQFTISWFWLVGTLEPLDNCKLHFFHLSNLLKISERYGVQKFDDFFLVVYWHLRWPTLRNVHKPHHHKLFSDFQAQNIVSCEVKLISEITILIFF